MKVVKASGNNDGSHFRTIIDIEGRFNVSYEEANKKTHAIWYNPPFKVTGYYFSTHGHESKDLFICRTGAKICLKIETLEDLDEAIVMVKLGILI